MWRLSLALAVTLVVVVLGRQVAHYAHQATSARGSENASFVSLATVLLTQENSLDGDLATLLTTGSRLSRVSFATDLGAMEQEVSSWGALAVQLRSPELTPSLNETLADETLARVRDYQRVLATVAAGLVLSGPAADPALTLGLAQLSLAATAASWGHERHELAAQPGGVTLAALTARSARLPVPGLVQALASSTNLAATRAVQIAAVQAQPAPLPAPRQVMELTPTSTLQIEVSVSNLREILQPVTMTMAFTPVGGSTQRVSQTQTLSPLTSYAFASHVFVVHPGEKGTLTIALNGIPAAAGLAHQRVYAVSVAPVAG